MESDPLENVFEKINREEDESIGVSVDEKFKIMTASSSETHYELWTKRQLSVFRRHLLAFGYGRWSKIRRADKILSQYSNREMRPYANWLLYKLFKCLKDKIEIITNE